LGCTHFPILTKNIKKFFIGDIVDPSKEAAAKFRNYLERHPEIKDQLTTGGQTTYYTTGPAEQFSIIGSRIKGEEIKAQQIEII
jgi:glutamate racemase